MIHLVLILGPWFVALMQYMLRGGSEISVGYAVGASVTVLCYKFIVGVK